MSSSAQSMRESGLDEVGCEGMRWDGERDGDRPVSRGPRDAMK